MGLCDEFRVKNATFCLHLLFWQFLLFFIKKHVTVIEHLIGWFPQQNISQLETGINGKKLPVELYDCV